ncbi:MAG: hypothetical protein ABIK85_02435 [Candidatus Eisenbacteria bacterium]
MKSEMDIMRMDERQRTHWLRANRATLMFVGVVWLLMIAFELSEGRTPGFLLVMVPVIAGIRLGFYYYYARDRDLKWIDRVLFVGLVALGHWLATMVAWVREFSTSGFLWFVPAEPSHGFWSGAARVLEFPIGTLVSDGSVLPDWLEVALIVLNSLFWAGAIYALVWAVRRRTRAREEAA